MSKTKKQHVSILATIVCLFVVGTAAAQDARSVVDPSAQTKDQPAAAPSVFPKAPEGVYFEDASSSECDCCEGTSGWRSGTRRLTLRQNRANTANFNCRVNGSYKYPVPKQYTYFWPGIYSQKTMTEYVSPFQGVKLRSPGEVFDGGIE
ncbi:MAG: hypothetical protein Q4D38_12680 [Planctomycetia bacterium]|nr:hypothetical protein [Planctomycetia bacterium]